MQLFKLSINKLTPYVRIIRPLNLGMLILIMVLVRYGIIGAVYQFQDLEYQFPLWAFIILAISVLLISAGGYAFNDLLDTETDSINKTDKVITGVLISYEKTEYYAWTLFITGIICGIIAAFATGTVYLAGIHIIGLSGLYIYSVRFKSTQFTGNILIAFLSCLSFYIIWLFEFFAARNHALSFIDYYKTLFSSHAIILVYVLFAFLFTLIREIIKDIADIQGDKQTHQRTMPVVSGVSFSRNISALISVLTLLLMLAAAIWLYINQYIFLFWYTVIAVVIPMIYFFRELMGNTNSTDYSFLGNLLKIIMLSGILSIQVLYISIN